MNEEPEFLLEALSRWDLGWRLSQTEGPILLPVPQDFHTTLEAIHHVRQLSAPLGCTLVMKPHPSKTGDHPQKDRVIEICRGPGGEETMRTSTR